MVKNGKYFVVDDKGEIVQTLGNGEFIYSQEKSVCYDGKINVRYKFLKLNSRALFEIDRVDRDYFDILVDNIRYETNRIYLKKGVPVRTRSDFGELFNINKKYAYVVVKRLIDKGIIGEIKVKVKGKYEKHYVFNPFIAMRGNKMARITYTHFESTKWKGMIRLESEKYNNVQHE